MTPCRKDSTSGQHLIEVQLALQAQEMQVDRSKLGVVPCCSKLALSIKGLLQALFGFEQLNSIWMLVIAQIEQHHGQPLEQHHKCYSSTTEIKSYIIKGFHAARVAPMTQKYSQIQWTGLQCRPFSQNSVHFSSISSHLTLL